MEYRRRRDVSLSELAVCGVAQLELRRLGEGHDIRKRESAQKPALFSVIRFAPGEWRNSDGGRIMQPFLTRCITVHGGA